MVDRSLFHQGQSPARATVILASKRGPVSPLRKAGKTRWIKSPGGLVQVVEPALQHGDRWVTMVANGVLPEPRVSSGPPGVEMHYASIDSRTSKLFDEACNRVLWFALHGFAIPSDISTGTLIASWEEGYRRANRRLAGLIAEEWKRSPAPISIQDYQLFLTPAELKELVPEAQIMFFCHTPFPTADQIRSLPFLYTRDILRGMLACDLVGFQSNRDVAAFRDVCSSLLGVTVRGTDIVWKGRRTELGVFPASVDPERVGDEESIEMPLVGENPTVITWVGRSDPAKNPLGAVNAFRQLVSEEPHLRENVLLWFKMYPSRQDLPEYRRCLLEAQEAAIRVNAEMSTNSWTPIFLDLSTERFRANAALRRADVLLVNSFADGMNLVVQEGLLLSQRCPALILSRTTGAWERFSDGAISVDPWDPEDLVSALRKAIGLTVEERARRHGRLFSRLASAAKPKEWLKSQVDRLQTSTASERTLELTNRG